MSSPLSHLFALCGSVLATLYGGGEILGATTGMRTAASGRSTRIDVCSLLTPEEIQAVVGWKPAQTKPSSYAGTDVCNYYGPKGYSQSVTLLVAPGMPKVASSAEMANWRKNQTEGFGDVKFIIEPIEGLGVPAIRNEIEGSSAPTIEVAVKGMLLDVSSSTLEEAKALATKAIARLAKAG